MSEATKQGGAYSQQKALYHTDRMEALRRGEQIVPTHVQLIISDLCSHDCKFCAYRMDGYTSNELFTIGAPLASFGHNNPKRMMPSEKAIEILDDCAKIGVKCVQFTGGGEPTVHPDHHDIIQHAINLGLEVSLVTHGCLLKSPTVELLAECALWVRISLDAGRKETYASIRRINETQFGRALSNVRQLADAKRRLASCIVVGVGFVVTADNWSEVEIAAKIAKDCGADSFRISAVFQPDNERYFRDFYDDAAELCKSCERLSGYDFTVTNSFGNRLEDLRIGHPRFKQCGYMQFTTYCAADLNVYRCCNTSYSKLGLIGSVKDQRFSDLWFSQAKQDDFMAFNPSACERCQFTEANQAIESALSSPLLPILGDPPPHVNFV